LTVRQEIAHLAHHVDRRLPVWHRDVDVEPEDEQRPRELLQLLDDALVARAGGEDLVLPVREGVRAGRGDREPDARRGRRQLVADAEDLLPQLAHVGADLRADFDDRLMQLALDLIAEHRRARRQQLRHVRPQLPRLRIDDLELLLDADGEPVHASRDSISSRPPNAGRRGHIRPAAPRAWSRGGTGVGSRLPLNAVGVSGQLAAGS
jgi:hypothetical protein